MADRSTSIRDCESGMASVVAQETKPGKRQAANNPLIKWNTVLDMRRQLGTLARMALPVGWPSGYQIGLKGSGHYLLTDVTQGAPKLALARIGVGAPKLALATYPSRLRLDVKASFDAPAIGPCVT
ncbi:MAG: hypothetical protein WCI11_14520, partial [Candidatus Methylumidiphilus sp.]